MTNILKSTDKNLMNVPKDKTKSIKELGPVKEYRFTQQPSVY